MVRAAERINVNAVKEEGVKGNDWLDVQMKNYERKEKPNKKSTPVEKEINEMIT